MTSPKEITQRNRLAAVGYVPVVNLLIFYVHRQEKFIARHALNGILLSLYLFIAYFFIPFFGNFVALFFAALAVGGFIHASAGQKYDLPLLSDFVDWVSEAFDKKNKAA